MPHLELLEVVGLAAFLVGVIPVVMDLRMHGRAVVSYVTAYVLLLVGSVVTVLEGAFLPDLLNLVEHSVGVMAAGASFAWMAYLSQRHIRHAKETGRSLGRKMK